MTARTLVGDFSALGPKIEFGDNLVAGGVAATVGTPAAIPGPDDSSWEVVQWGNTQLLSPGNLRPAGNGTGFSWATPDGETSLGAVSTPSGWVYSIHENSNPSTGFGEHDLFLQTAAPLAQSLSADVRLSLDAAVTDASVNVTNGQPDYGSEVLAYATVAATLNFNLPGSPSHDASLPSFGAFLQMPLASSGGSASFVEYFDTGAGLAEGGPVISNELLPGDASLAFAPTATTHLSYDLDAYVSRMASVLETGYGQPAALSDLSRWTLGGVYVGVGASAGNPRDGENDGAAGTSSLGIQVSHLSLVADDGGPAVAAEARAGSAGITGHTDPDGSYAETLAGGGTATVAQDGLLAFPDGSVAFHDSTGAGATVERLFEAVFHHPGNGTGVQFWATGIDQGLASREQVAKSFLDSGENVSLGAKDDAAFVNQTFEGAFGRDVTGPALQFYVSALGAGTSRADILLDISDSPEAQARSFGSATSPEDAYVYQAFRTVLGFAPDTPALMFYGNLMDHGATKADIARDLMGSPGYVASAGSLGDAGFVDLLYRQGLGRAADDGGKSAALSSLASGADRAAMAAGMADSAEARSAWSPVTHADLITFPHA